MRTSLIVALAAGAAACIAGIVPAAASAAQPPADRVVVMYFHRTERCPTCRKMGSASSTLPAFTNDAACQNFISVLSGTSLCAELYSRKAPSTSSRSMARSPRFIKS